MARYSKQPIKKTFGGKRVFLTTRYPKIPRRVSDVYVIVTEADRLDTLAHQFYGKADLYWIIATANNVGKGTFRFNTGQQLRIPTETESIILEFNKINNVT